VPKNFTPPEFVSWSEELCLACAEKPNPGKSFFQDRAFHFISERREKYRRKSERKRERERERERERTFLAATNNFRRWETSACVLRTHLRHTFDRRRSVATIDWNNWHVTHHVSYTRFSRLIPRNDLCSKRRSPTKISLRRIFRLRNNSRFIGEIVTNK